MNRCKQCGREVWESETTCAECQELSTEHPKPATAPSSPFESIFNEAAFEPAKIKIKAPIDVKAPAFDEPPAPTDDDLADVAFAQDEDDFDPVLDYQARTAAAQEPALTPSQEPSFTHSAPAPAASSASAAAAVMEPPAAKVAVAAAPAAKAARGSNRKPLLAGLLVVLGGTLTFAMLRPAPEAYPAAVPAPVVNKPAAPKPDAPKPAAAASNASATAPATPAAAPTPTATPAPAPAPSPAAATPTPTPSAAPPVAAAPKPAPATVPAPVAAPTPVKPAVPAPAPVASPAPATLVKPAAAPTPAAAPAAAAPVVASKWISGNQDWLTKNKKAVAFEVKSVNRVAIWQGISQPVLVVRCDAGRVQAFVYTASAIQMEPIDENHSVGIRFDDQPESSERWADSSEHDALFAPDGAAFASKIANASKLRFSYKPHNANRAVAEFPTSGLLQAMEPVAKQCGLK
jgi:hypothetical protein